MNNRSTISTGNIPTLLTTVEKLTKAIKSIEQYAYQDFDIIKTVLDQYKLYRSKHPVESVLQEKFSRIISELQYIDTLHQRLSHIAITKERLVNELEALPNSIGPYALAYWFIVKLNEVQFRAAIDHYVETTHQIQQVLQEIAGKYGEVFYDLAETGSFYGYNNNILSKAALVCDVYFDTLLKHRHPGDRDPLAKQCIDVVMDISKLYTMEAERKVLNQFLKAEMSYDNGHDQDPGREMISIF